MSSAVEQVAVDHKLDGIRIQAHKDGATVLVTRSLEDMTDRLPEVADVVRALPARRVVLDEEALALGLDGWARTFQETAAPTAPLLPAEATVITPFFFDLLLRDDVDLLEAPAADRWRHLEELVPAERRVGRLVTTEEAAAEEFLAGALRGGHEGGRAEVHDGALCGRPAWCSLGEGENDAHPGPGGARSGAGRRAAPRRLSNIHLGARDPVGGFVMLGKTFKVMTDEMLAWQTERFTELTTDRSN